MKRRKQILAFVLAFSMITTSMSAFGNTVKAQEKKQAREGTVIDVTDFGADPSGAEDSAAAIQEAIEAAKEAEGPVTISFPKGRYDIYPDQAAERELYISNTVGTNQGYKDKKIGILLEDMENVTVDGNDSLFMFHGKMMTFAAIDCKNVTFENYAVDFQVPTVIDITVEKTEGNTAMIYVPECYNYEIDGTSVKWLSDVSPYTGQRYWTTTNNMNYTQIYDTVNGLTWRSGNPVFSNVRAIEDTGNHRLKFTYNQISNDIKTGYCYQMRTTVRDHAGTFFWKSKDITLQNLDIQYLHGFGMVGQFSENITLKDVDFVTPKESGRTTAGYADFIQMSGCKGKIDISGCEFSNPHDDPINIHGTFLQVVEKISDRKFKVRYMHNETAGFPNYFVGDEVEFMTKGNMIPVTDSIATITAVDGPDGKGGNMGAGSGSLTDIIITLDRDVPGEIGVGTHVVENITYTPEVYIHDNVFKETPTRGILVTTRKPILIEDNLFDGMGMAGIYISNDAQGWYESGPTKDVTIRNNVFTRGKSQAIYVEPTNPTVSVTQTVHENMTIEDNTFFMENQRVLDAKSVKNLVFKNNKIYRYDPLQSFVLSAGKTHLEVGNTEQLQAQVNASELNTKIYNFNGCKNVIIEHNSYDGGINAGSSYYNMQDSDIKATDDIVKVGSDNKISTNGKIYYESSDEDIVKVSSGGTVNAVGEGTAAVTAYMMVGGRKFEANTVDFTVSGGNLGIVPTDVLISADRENVMVNDSVQYTAEVVGESGVNEAVSWAVTDADTGMASSKAEISDTGLLTAHKAGVVEVIARTVNGLEARKLLTIQAESFKLTPNFTVDFQNAPDKWWAKDDAIEMEFVNGGLYQEQVQSNVIVGTMDEDLTNVTATVKVNGRTEGSWAALGFYFYKDQDNYVSMERKHRGGNTRKIALVKEENQRGAESFTDVVDDMVVYFKLEKINDNVKGYYSIDEGANWIFVGEYPAAFLGNRFKIGFATLTDERNGNPARVTYSDLIVNGKKIPLTQKDSKPEVSEVSVHYEEDNNMLSAEYRLQPEDSKVLVKWAVADTAAGNYKVIDGMAEADIAATKAMSGKFVKAAVIPVNAAGIPGDITWTDAVEITGQGADSEEGSIKSANAYLKTAEIKGLLNGFVFDKNIKTYFTTAAMEEKEIDVRFVPEKEGASAEVIVNDEIMDSNAGKIVLAGGRNVIEVNVTAEDGITVRNYRFTISRAGDNNAGLRSLSVDDDEIILEDGKKVYEYSVEEAKEITVKAEAVSSRATADIVCDRTISKDGKIALKEGCNKVTVIVNPETSAAPTYYTLNVKVPKADNANLEKAVFGDNVKLDRKFTSDVQEYMGAAAGENVEISVASEEKDAKIIVVINGKRTAQAIGSYSKTLSVKEGENTIIVRVISPDRSVEKEYTFKLEGKAAIYLSDLDWEENSTTGWGSLQKDLEAGGIPMTLKDEKGSVVSFEKGIGAHATSDVYYNLDGKGYKKFEVYAGVDASQSGNGAVQFEVLIDGVSRIKTDVLTSNSPMVKIAFDIPADAKVLQLRALEGENNYNDHADWADAKFITSFGTEEEKTEYVIQVNGEDAVRGAYNEAVSVTAPQVEGKQFAGWTLEGYEDVILSKDATYRFFIAGDMNLIPLYEETEEQPLAIMMNQLAMKQENGKSNMRFVGQIVVPKEYKLMNAGLVWSTKDSTELTLEGGLKPTFITKISTTGQFSVTINGLLPDMKLRGRIFAQMQDRQGKVHTVYSEESRLYAR